MHLTFYSGEHQLNDLVASVVVIIGTGRSGKTTIGNILGSCQGVEHLDEPWLPKAIPLFITSGDVSESLGIRTFQANLVEMIYDRILLRHVNFRSEDLSTIWNQKTPQDIFDRMRLKTREDARVYASDHPITLVLTLGDTIPDYELLLKILPMASIIHVMRDGVEVAVESTNKHWFSNEEMMNPVVATPYLRYCNKLSKTEYFLPYWVEPKTEERYIKSSEFARGLHYWRRYMDIARVVKEGAHEGFTARTIRWSDLINDSSDTVHELIGSMGLTPTHLTEARLMEIGSNQFSDISNYAIDDIVIEELNFMKTIYKAIGLPSETIEQIVQDYS